MNEPRPLAPPSCESFYRHLQAQCAQVLGQSFSGDNSVLQNAGHGYVSDFEKWLQVSSGRPEAVLLKSALREYNFALFALVQGQYRQAFMALRLFLELALGAVHFSANELELRVWLQGNRDVNWHAIVEPEKGVFSKTFVGAFFEALKDEAPTYRAIAGEAYRECSEYVHGNANTNELPDALVFNQDAFSDWHEKARNIRLAVQFALCARYAALATPDQRQILERMLLDELGHLAPVRLLFAAIPEVH